MGSQETANAAKINFSAKALELAQEGTEWNRQARKYTLRGASPLGREPLI